MSPGTFKTVEVLFKDQFSVLDYEQAVDVLVLSLEDPIVVDSVSPRLRAALQRRLVSASSTWPAVARFWLAQIQKSIERRHARARRSLLKMEESLKQTLAFGGRSQ